MPVISRLQNTAATAKDKATASLNSYISPAQRKDLYDTSREWCLQNPKLAAFIAAHVLLTSTPLLFFVFFALSILVFSISTCVLVALTLALTFSAFCIGCALLILIPTLCFTTIAATCLWAWAVVAWWVVARFRQSELQVPFVSGWEKKGGNWDGVWRKGTENKAGSGGSSAVTYASNGGLVNGD